jgi:sigma-54 dependent transcriptional regulator, flagellar regulatory protein
METDLAARLIGTSTAMAALRSSIARVAASDASVIIGGPSGAGKEVAAQAIHAASARYNGPMIAVNCGAIPADLLESELFGHEKGSFTGAIAQRKGRFEQACGGTLFLDEIGDMPAAMQVKLLRVLEDRCIERVGGHQRISVNVRILCASHRDLRAEVAAGRFREDLYFRLAVVPITVPPLADRAGDIPDLIAHLQAISLAQQAPQFATDALARLMAYRWPGNVRELRNLVERAAILHPGEMIDAAMADALIGNAAFAAPAQAGPDALPGIDPMDLKAMLADVERRHLLAALAAAHGVVADAARMVRMNRTTFLEKMKRHDVTRPGLPVHNSGPRHDFEAIAAR